MSHSRLFQILYYLLDKGSATAPQLAAEFEVSVRTIYRDVEALSGAGIPVYAEPGRNGGIYLLDHFVLDKVMLSQEEKEAVLTAIQGMAVTGYVSEKEILTKLSALFQVNTSGWIEVDFSRWGSQSYDNSKFELLKTAIIQHREIKMTYESAYGGRSERTVQPLKLCYRAKGWYLKAFCLAKKGFRIFKVNRILNLEILEQRFIPVPYTEPEEEQKAVYEKTVILFSKETAYRVYDEFDETQIACMENGDFMVTAEMPVDGWLIGYLLSFGTEVEVIEPKYLKDTLAQLAKEIYEKNKS